MNLSLILTVNNRAPEVSKKVADSFKLPGNNVDEVVVVLDRPAEEVREGATTAYSSIDASVKFVEIEGSPGWICPAKAWNAGYDAATGDFFYQISSEVVQDAGNVDKARTAVANAQTAVFGSCHNSEPTQMVTGAEAGLLASSTLPRPLGFIVCYPAWAMKKIGGNDLEFMNGLWYEDDDLFLRMWRTGLNFMFDDSIHGTHLHHERPGLNTPEGQEGIRKNGSYMIQKHGTLHPWGNLPRIEEYQEGRLVWKHV